MDMDVTMVTTKTPKSLIFQSVTSPCMVRSNRINSVCMTAGEDKCENRLGLAEKAPRDFVIYDSVFHIQWCSFLCQSCLSLAVFVKSWGLKPIFFSLNRELRTCCSHRWHKKLFTSAEYTHPYTHCIKLHQTDISGNDLYFICLVCEKT